jgi:hypothetical protein
MTLRPILALLAAAAVQVQLPAADDPTAPHANLAAYGWLSLAEGAVPRQRLPVPFLARADNTSPAVWKQGSVLLLEWQHPRPVSTVRLEFAEDAPPAEAVRIEWWRRVWPEGGIGGWMKLDDPFNGQWTVARAGVETEGNAMTFRFAALDAREAPGLRQAGFEFRQTYRLRISCDRDARVTQVAAWSDAVLQRARLRFEWGLRTTVPGEWAPRFEARNGRVLADARSGARVAVVEVEYADAPDRLSPDRGQVVFRSGPAQLQRVCG